MMQQLFYFSWQSESTLPLIFNLKLHLLFGKTIIKCHAISKLQVKATRFSICVLNISVFSTSFSSSSGRASCHAIIVNKIIISAPDKSSRRFLLRPSNTKIVPKQRQHEETSLAQRKKDHLSSNPFHFGGQNLVTILADFVSSEISDFHRFTDFIDLVISAIFGFQGIL